VATHDGTTEREIVSLRKSYWCETRRCGGVVPTRPAKALRHVPADLELAAALSEVGLVLARNRKGVSAFPPTVAYDLLR